MRPHPRLVQIAPQVALPKGDVVVGKMSSAATIHFSVYLHPGNQAKLASALAAVTNPHATQFERYLRPGQFAQEFGAPTSTVTLVRSTLAAEGFTVAPTLTNGVELQVSGTAGALARAWSTRLERVRRSDGTTAIVTQGGVLVPASIAPAVVSVVGLNDAVVPTATTARHDVGARRPTQPGLGRSFALYPHDVAGGPSACTAAQKATTQGFGGISDDQVASAYGITPLYSSGDLGKGQTVAVLELEPFKRSDIAAFETCYLGTDATSHLRVENVDGGAGTGAGSGEAALDIEDVAALAPSADIVVYSGSNSSTAWLDTYGAIVTDDTAKIATTSWGWCEAAAQSEVPGSVAVENLIFEQAALQGQTFFASSGDDGNDDCAGHGSEPTSPVLGVDDPAAQPYVVGVGGTRALSVATPPAQQAWNDGSTGGASGGGASSIWPEPSWQQTDAQVAGAASSATCGPTGKSQCRVVPDVSAFADEYTGITIYYDGSWGLIGGTSSSAPMWAAMLAEVNDSASCKAAASTAQGVGFLEPLLYQVAKSPSAYASSFTDVTSGNNDLFNTTSGRYAARTGFDAVTGLGSPELSGVGGPGLAQNLCAAAQANAAQAVTAIAPASGPITGGTKVTITGSGFSTSSVTGVSFGLQAAASYVVTSPTTIVATTAPAVNLKGISKTYTTTAGPVTVSLSGARSLLGPSFSYLAVVAAKGVPAVLEVGPSGGPLSGGTTVSIRGTGFTGATSVHFGPVAASSFTIESPTLIEAVAPAERSSMCAAADLAHATWGLCQVEVTVSSASGTSATVVALPPLTGALQTGSSGVISVPASCKCEAYPSLTEFDYGAVPVISSLVDVEAQDAKAQADPSGGDTVVLRGTGLNVLTTEWVDFGDPSSPDSIQSSIVLLNATGTELVTQSLSDPAPSPTGDQVPVVVVGEGGTSGSQLISYGPIPVVTKVSSEVLPSAGGTALTITGAGFTSVQDVGFVYFGQGSDGEVFGNFTVVSPTEITLTSPALLQGAYVVNVQSIYGNSADDVASIEPTPATTATYYAALSQSTVVVTDPGGPALTAMTTASGGFPTSGVAGGATLELTGVDLGTPDQLSSLVVYVGLDKATIVDDTVTNGEITGLEVTTPPSYGEFASIVTTVVETPSGQTPEAPFTTVIYR